MTGYTFVYGVDGFGADVDPAYEEGIYLDYNKAYNHLKELTTQIIENEIQDEIIYIDDHEYKRNEIEAICQALTFNATPPFNFYAIIKVDIYE